MARVAFAIALALLVAVPLVPAANAGWRFCSPAAVAANTLLVNGDTYYARETRDGAGGVYVEIWKESNGISGLQTSTYDACGGVSDTLVAQLCNGGYYCHGQFGAYDLGALL